jgi:hypothetical protein
MRKGSFMQTNRHKGSRVVAMPACITAINCAPTVVRQLQRPALRHFVSPRIFPKSTLVLS